MHLQQNIEQYISVVIRYNCDITIYFSFWIIEMYLVNKNSAVDYQFIDYNFLPH